MSPSVVVLGAGPVGLWTAIQMKKRAPATSIVVYERYQSYRRSHVLRLSVDSLCRFAYRDETSSEAEFFQDITGAASNAKRARHISLRTQELEATLRRYAECLGIAIHYEEVKSTRTLRERHPDCQRFIGADGAHSLVRREIFDNEYSVKKDLHFVAELKYDVAGKTRPLDLLTEQYKSLKLMPHSVFEYIGRERDSLTPITLRFFIDRDVYNAIGEATFKAPVTVENYRQKLPPKLSRAINLYLTIRKELLGDDPVFSTMKLGTLTLGVYGSATFAKRRDGAEWYLVGDAAMGVPFFRSLNAGLLCGSKLAQLLSLSSDLAVDYNVHASRRLAIEHARARLKSVGVNLHAAFVRASAVVPWQVNRWRRQDIEHYMQRLYEDEVERSAGDARAA
jgi:2-polyprenyl-6-methoxyphenol hydroxylase-like FAD-dependent oxidoreductase